MVEEDSLNVEVLLRRMAARLTDMADQLHAGADGEQDVMGFFAEGDPSAGTSRRDASRHHRCTSWYGHRAASRHNCRRIPGTRARRPRSRLAADLAVLRTPGRSHHRFHPSASGHRPTAPRHVTAPRHAARVQVPLAARHEEGCARGMKFPFVFVRRPCGSAVRKAQRSKVVCTVFRETHRS